MTSGPTDFPGGLRTRFAPTPGGYLHSGNAWAFLLAWCLARKLHGRIALRIDDIDLPRYRESYLEDIFASLGWLGLDYDEGPDGPQEFHAGYGFASRLPRYQDALSALRRVKVDGLPAVYACVCSRKQMREQGGKCPCRSEGHDLDAVGVAWRLHSPPGETVRYLEWEEGYKQAEVHVVAGDFVVRQRDGQPGYHLCSLVDDEFLRMNCIVRGSDLLPSTAAQLLLARRLSLNAFPAAVFVHHGLLCEETGGKLSKSADSRALCEWRTQGASSSRLLGWFASRLGIPISGKESSAAQILSAFNPSHIPRQNLPFNDLLAHLEAE